VRQGAAPTHRSPKAKWCVGAALDHPTIYDYASFSYRLRSLFELFEVQFSWTPHPCGGIAHKGIVANMAHSDLQDLQARQVRDAIVAKKTLSSQSR